MEELLRSLPALIDDFEDNETVREAVVMAVWRKIAGESLNEHAVPFRLYQKHLVISVKNETWKRHLENLSGQMIFKLNSMLGKAVVTFIEFRIDEENVFREKNKNNRQAVSEIEFENTALDEVTVKMRRSADAIEDDNLRFNFLLAAGSCLSRKKKLLQKQ